MIAVTPLGYALLGLMRGAPQTGYGLRMVFETTPLGNYSSSPGSIYPALKTLLKAGLAETRRKGGDGRGGELYYLTPAGEAAFETWLCLPVTLEEVQKRLPVIMLRFAFLTGHPDRKLTLDLLASLEAAARDQVRQLETFLAGDFASAMPLQSRLAVGQGVASTRSVADWAADARRQLIEAAHNAPNGETI